MPVPFFICKFVNRLIDLSYISFSFMLLLNMCIYLVVCFYCFFSPVIETKIVTRKRGIRFGEIVLVHHLSEFLTAALFWR